MVLFSLLRKRQTNVYQAIVTAMMILSIHDIEGIIKDIDRADVIGPFLDPTLWMNKNKSMMEDKEVFEAALPLIRKFKEIREMIGNA